MGKSHFAYSNYVDAILQRHALIDADWDSPSNDNELDQLVTNMVTNTTPHSPPHVPLDQY